LLPGILAAIHPLRLVRRQDATSGLTGPRLSALSVLVFAGPLSLKALAAAEQVRPPTMSQIVAALIEAGLVVRTSDPVDRRAVVRAATPAGRQLLEQGRARRTADLARRLAALSPSEVETVRRAAEIIDRLSK
jgi:DNA-binding MarR family transcriptional regulator